MNRGVETWTKKLVLADDFLYVFCICLHSRCFVMLNANRSIVENTIFIHEMGGLPNRDPLQSQPLWGRYHSLSTKQVPSIQFIMNEKCGHYLNVKMWEFVLKACLSYSEKCLPNIRQCVLPNTIFKKCPSEHNTQKVSFRTQYSMCPSEHNVMYPSKHESFQIVKELWFSIFYKEWLRCTSKQSKQFIQNKPLFRRPQICEFD